jgi:hypothetical protein
LIEEEDMVTAIRRLVAATASALLMMATGCSSPDEIVATQTQDPLPQTQPTTGDKPSGVTKYAATYDPLADTSLVVCLDHLSSFYKDTAGTQPCADGDSCAVWADRSGKGNNAVAVSGHKKPVFRSNALGRTCGLLWGGDRQSLSIHYSAGLSVLQGSAFTVFAAASYHAGQGFIVSSAGDAGGGLFGMSVFNGVVGKYNRDNKGVPPTVDDFISFAVVNDPTKTEVNGIKRFYQNGVPRMCWFSGTPDAGNTISVGSVSETSQDYSWNGRIFAVMIFRRTLSAAEVFGVDQYLRGVYGQAWQGASSPMYVLWDGNSMSTDGVLPGMVAQALGIPYEAVFNFAWGSKTTERMIAYAPQDVDPLVSAFSGGKPVVSVCMEITNDLSNLSYQRVKTYGLARQALGMKHVTATCLPSQYRNETTRLAINDSVRTNYRLFADALADIGYDPNMGQTGQGSTDYYYDGIHPSLKGDTTLTPYFTNAITAVTASTGVLNHRY